MGKLPEDYGREQCRRLFPGPLGTCEHEGCGAAATDRHHIDSDTFNNDRSNVAFLCRRHHMLIDGRLAAIAAFTPPVKAPEPCANCQRLAKPLRRGRCHACNEYLRRTGAERPVDGATGQVLVIKGHGAIPPGWKKGDPLPGSPVHDCEHCGASVRAGYFAKGRCKRCYEYRRINGRERPVKTPA